MSRQRLIDGGWFAGIFLALLLAGREKFFQDPGTFWHAEVGRCIIAEGQLPKVDRYSLSKPAAPWCATQWLGEWGMAITQGAWGWDGLLAGSALLLAITFGWVVLRWRRAGWSALPVLLVLMWVIACSSHHFHVRPHLATMLGMAALMDLLCEVENRSRPLWRLAALAPMFALWANLHGGALGGLATLLCAIGGWGLWQLAGRHWPQRWSSPLNNVNTANAIGPGGRAMLAGVIAVACAGALCATPYGFDTLRTWQTVMQMDLPELIEEHAPLSLRRPEGLATALLLLAYAISLANVCAATRRAPRVVWLLPLLWGGLAVLRVRHAPLFALVAGVAWADLLPHTTWAAAWRKRGWLQASSPAGTWQPWFAGAVIAAALGVGAWLLSFTGGMSPLQHPASAGRWARLAPALWPTDWVAELQSSGPAPRRVLNSLELGGFVIAHAPHWKILIDDRCELYGEALLREYSLAESSQPQVIDEWAATYAATDALVRAGSPFDQFLEKSPGWTLYRRSPAAAWYARTD